MDLLERLRMAVRLRRRLVEPKIYAVVQRDPEGSEHLYVGIHYDFHDALENGREKANAANPGKKFNIHPEMWHISSLGDVLEACSRIELDPAETPDGKNRVMRDLLAGGDLEALEARRGELTANEYEYLRDEIKRRAE